jgi:hypothetical protein
MMTVSIAKSDNDRAWSAAYISFKNIFYMCVTYTLQQIWVLVLVFFKTNPTMTHRIRSRIAIFALKNSRDLYGEH